MTIRDEAHDIRDVEALEALYGTLSYGTVIKEADHIHPLYRVFIEAAPFAVLATGGPDGLDVSPRGDAPGFVIVEDEKTLLIPDRRGNNRIDSLRNILADPRVALLFLIPGVDETLRVMGRTAISANPELLKRFAVDGKEPRSVLVVTVELVFFHCSRPLVRAALWNPDKHVDRATLPSPGEMLAVFSDSQIDGEKYDRELPDRQKATLY